MLVFQYLSILRGSLGVLRFSMNWVFAVWLSFYLYYVDFYEVCGVSVKSFGVLLLLLSLVIYNLCVGLGLGLDTMGLFILSLLIYSMLMLFNVDSWLVFYCLYEWSVVPLLYGIMKKGGYMERYHSCYYLLIYMLFFSFPFLMWLTMVFMSGGSMDMGFLFNISSGILIFVILLFLVKVPMYGFHSWLPKVHVESPMWGSVILAAILIKMGLYGCMQFMVEVNSGVNYYLIVLFGVFSLLGGLFSGLMCLCNIDIKVIIAFSSVFHMTGGLWLALFNIIGFNWGLLILVLFHGFISAGLFIFVSLVGGYIGSRNVLLSIGVMSVMSFLGFLCLMLFLFNMGVPFGGGLLGEFEFFYSLFQSGLGYLWVSLILVFSLVYNMVFFGNISLGENFQMEFMYSELMVLGLLLVISMFILFLFMNMS
uniref:NADH-ubiquinone oxidoreductase chain 4 n=1 Tax=Leptorhynchoides thecatus TaxID=60532 RepID=Q5DNB9_LEPTH|nr:NADH dehydrogenase subunit 4 [Leptorhynchoides thecatus]AAT64938.1 NADH dehydrogenase subunit 4 [Leptorhynchoides thecatus]